MSTTSSQHKSPRVLACVLCQHRKIKCDRNTPCSNCIKANVTCTPSTPAPARKRRRPNQDLQERLARCEALLKQYATTGSTTPPAGPPTVSSILSPSTQPTPSSTAGPSPSITQLPLPTGTASILDDIGSPATSQWKPAGKVVVEDGSVRFMDSYLWATVHDQLTAMRQIIEAEEEEQSVLGSDAVTPDDNVDLLLNDFAAIDLEDVTPSPVQIFRLWQVFLERVNPITKLIHVPSLQPLVVEAAANHSNVANNAQALLFSIYLVATLTMTEAEARQMLDSSKEDALKKFTAGVKAALTKVNFLKNHDMMTLQSLILYLVSLQGRYNRHAAWVLSGVLIRIAQKMGLHRDGDSLNLTPYETEMRRRLWWQIIMLDTKYAMVSGFCDTLLPWNWDTKTPQNVNDADLFPGSTEPVQPREGPTEMAFCLLLYEVGRFIVENRIPDFEAVVLGAMENESPESQATNLATLAKYRTLVDNLDSKLIALEKKYCDPLAGNIHIVATKIRSMIIDKMRTMMIPMRELPEWGTEIFNVQDNMFRISLMHHEHNVELYEFMENTGFVWFFKLHFQIDVFIVMAGQLYKRPTGRLADRAWKVIDRVYQFHEELWDMSRKENVQLGIYMLKAWRARERSLVQLGMPYETPLAVPRLQDIVPQSNSEVSSAGPSPAQPMKMEVPPRQDQPMDQYLGNFLDTTNFYDLDMWADLGVPNGNMNQQSAANMFGTFGNFGAPPTGRW
ncbi:Aurofusarin cluster transcription factor aurR2 [Colletotrichum siamense]|uniref:Aurofusarin cluster transcription factor aurR2 n=1 Tax=Colletotrichum siamense TaxID=690259 RepID=UPI001872BA94|nr:Aurofusarin cluster transcription factor aurR2 [Colletotrichum siamense]XP_037181786.1 Aurofusarin cluster transcription factor aurR2 [Colletotrichum aenigma]KAF4930959.1 Aurofusarin cluster transcription factor aurR2 [Colletotrichum viniferum]KAF4808896.1 Aurofusarin cluster transcription factor aurR2 [Colletotrichum siamense]KAF5505158.1 Aurofusarin cluster transcription factor aurR2 [Colletotrichum siamense]KAF5524147.1 Aurofusarin cluster transcription factor aurR2 [Colletotrichum aenig